MRICSGVKSINLPNCNRSILPTFRQIFPWMWTRRTFDSTFSWFCRCNAFGVVSTTGPFQHLEVPPYADGCEELVISILETI